MPKASNVIPMPQSLQQRFDKQIGVVFDQLEDPNLPIPFKERVAALYVIIRIQAAAAKLGGGSNGSGSSVRKYSAAFKNAASRGKGSPRSIPRSLDLEDDDEPDIA